MHLIPFLIVAAIIIFFYVNRRPVAGDDARFSKSSTESIPRDGVSRKVAFISRGKLFCHTGEAIREIHSPYVQGVMDRMEQRKQRHGWKEGTAFGTSFVGGRQAVPGDALRIHATSARFMDGERLLYFLSDESFGGLFEYNLASGEEKRLLHRQNLRFDNLLLDSNAEEILCAQHAANGSANICRMRADGSDLAELTGGDTVDTAPAWADAQRRQVVFQSSGLARNEHGYVVAQGPASIQLLDLEDGGLTTVFEDERLDFLQPRVDGDGSLYFIRRPYEAPRYGGGQALTDFILFPFRLLRAVFHYLNFFSLMYSRKPLTGAGGPEVQADLKDILVKGRRFDAEQALRKGRTVAGVPSLVPASWQLVRRTRDGKEDVIASHVAAYDLAPDGRIVWSNGYGVFEQDTDGSRVLLRDKLIAELIAG